MNKLIPRLLLGLSLGVLTLVGAAGCHNDTGAVNAATVPDNSGPDPADANMAPVDNNQPQPAPQGAVLGIRYQAQPQQVAASYAPQYPPQEAAPPPPDQDQAYQDAQTLDELDAEGETQPVEYADEPPPPLPVYEQPEIPAPNYIWVPGYWYWGPAGYYWIPGYWCAPPYYGALWTPGYWGWHHNRWGFHRGYWGLHIGFYGGINYGFGYTGYGYYGGYWNGNHFYYNRSVNRIGGNITYVYNRTVVVNNNTRVAYNGGRGGVAVRPRPAEIEAMRGPRTPPMSTQIQNQREAAQNRQQFYNVNRGRPAMVAAPRPIAAQPGFTRPNPGTMPNRPGQPAVQPGFRPGEPNNRPGVQPGQPEIRPVQPGNRPAEPNNRPQVQPVRPGEPQVRPVQPEQPRPTQPEVHPVHPDNRPNQPQVRPVQPQQPQPRPSYQPRPEQQVRPQPEARPVQPQPMPQPRPQPEYRPAPQPQSRPALQPQSRPAPQQQARPEQSRPAPHDGDRPH